MNDKVKVGQILNENEGVERDAIHVAIAPVIAGCNLNPGDHVGFLGEVVIRKAETLIGIVDPFLMTRIKEGEVLYLFLYPNTVTGMRHHWIHPAFEILKQRETSPCSESEKWISRYADSLSLTYKDLMDGAEDYIKYGTYLSQGGKLESLSVSEEFWVHYENVTGGKGSGSFFSCSCD